MGTDLLHLFSDIVHERYGIIRSVRPAKRMPDLAWTYTYNACLNRPLNYRNGAVTPCEGRDLRASGTGLTEAEALRCVLGEGIERYAAVAYSDPDITRAPYTEIRGRAIRPHDFVAYSREQYATPGFPYQPFDETEVRDWVWAKNIVTDDEILVPASLVWLDYSPSRAREFFTQPISTGLASGDSLQRAVLAGLLEVLERDAFMCHWLLSHRPTWLDPGDRRLRESQVAHVLAEAAYDVRVALLSMDHSVPCVLAAIGPRNRARVALGAASKTTLQEAIRKSVVEALQTCRWSEEIMRTDFCKIDMKEIRDFEHHLRYYQSEDHAGTFDLILGYNDRDFERESVENGLLGAEIDLSSVANDLLRLGYESYYVDITTDDIAGLGFHVVRVLVPGFQPLYCGYGMEYGDRRRLGTMANHWELPQEFAINEVPHPFT